MQELIIFIFILGISFLIAQFLGTKRYIGFGWSFFFCLFLTIIGGVIVTLLSKSVREPAPQHSNAKKLWGWVIVVFFSISLLGQLGSIGSGYGDPMQKWGALSMTIGFIGLGIYLIELAKGKAVNTSQSTISSKPLSTGTPSNRTQRGGQSSSQNSGYGGGYSGGHNATQSSPSSSNKPNLGSTEYQSGNPYN